MKIFQTIYLFLLPIIHLIILHYFGFEITVVYILSCILIELYRKDLINNYEEEK